MINKNVPPIEEMFTLEQRYEMATSGEYGVFEIYSSGGDVQNFRGYRKEYGTTGVYSTFREALEAAMCEFGNSTD